MLSKMEVVDKPFTLRDDMHLKLTPCIRSGREVLTVENLAKSFDGHSLFSGLSFHIRRGEHVAMIGDNGTGKTTILRILNGLLGQDQGHIRLGTNVHIGYYDQEHHVLDDRNTVFEEIAYAYPSMTNTEVRNLLASFLFTGDDVFKLIGELSGGEKGRVSLAKLMLSEANLLILDEPTNHLDIVSREVLENALNSYDGTVLYVSHDRYFINRTASRILELTQKVLVNYPGNNSETVPDRFIGNYDFYVEKSAQVGEKLIADLHGAGSREAAGQVSSARSGSAAASAAGKGSSSAAGTSAASAGSSSAAAPAAAGTGGSGGGVEDWKTRKEEQARRRKIANDLKKCENEIARLESEGEALDGEISLPENSTDPDRLRELTAKREAIDEKLSSLYEQWETLSELADE